MDGRDEQPLAARNGHIRRDKVGETCKRPLLDGGQIEISDADVINLTRPGGWTGVVFEQLCMYQPSLISVSDRPDWIDGTDPDR